MSSAGEHSLPQAPDGQSTRLLRRASSRYLLAIACIPILLLAGWFGAGPRGYGKAFGVYEPGTFFGLVGVAYLLAWAVYFLLSRTPDMKKITAFFMMTFSFVFIFGLFELPALLGVIDYRKVVAPPESVLYTRIKPWQNPKNQLDGELLHIHLPNQRITGQTVGDLVYYLGIAEKTRYPIDIQYDRNGFRNDHPTDQADVVVLGDSFVESGLVSQSELLTSQLSSRLGVEVANLGQSGYGPQQELVVLNRYGLPLKPKVAVWLFFEGNDLLDIPRYESLIRHWDAHVREINSFSQRSFTRNASLAFVGLTERGLKVDTEEARKRSCQVRIGTSGMSQTLYFAYPGQPLTQGDLANLGKAEDIFLKARESSVDAGTQLVLVFVPTKFRVYDSLCHYPGDGYGLEWKPNDLPERLGQWAGNQGIPFMDLTPALKEAAGDGELVYFRDDGHWNGAGSETAAIALSQLIKPLLASQPGESLANK